MYIALTQCFLLKIHVPWNKTSTFSTVMLIVLNEICVPDIKAPGYSDSVYTHVYLAGWQVP